MSRNLMGGDMNTHEQDLFVSNLQIENEQYKEKVAELENWVILLLNNFYEGN